jgi:hypothetical protein
MNVFRRVRDEMKRVPFWNLTAKLKLRWRTSPMQIKIQP